MKMIRKQDEGVNCKRHFRPHGVDGRAKVLTRGIRIEEPPTFVGDNGKKISSAGMVGASILRHENQSYRWVPFDANRGIVSNCSMRFKKEKKVETSVVDGAHFDREY